MQASRWIPLRLDLEHFRQKTQGLRQEMPRQMAKTIPTTPFEWNRFRLAKRQQSKNVLQ